MKIRTCNYKDPSGKRLLQVLSNMSVICRFTGCILILYFLFSSNLYAVTPVVIDDNTESVSFGRYMEILEDPTGKLAIEDVTKPEMNDRWFQSKWDVPNFGYSKSAFWVKMKIINDTDRTRNFIIDIDYPPIRYIEYYLINNNRIIETKTAGLNFKTSHKEIKYPGYSFGVEFKPDQDNLIFLKSFGSNTMQFPINLVSSKQFFEKKNNDVLMSGLLLGFLIVMALYNFFVFMSIRDISYLFYIMYIIGILFGEMTFKGIGVSYIYDYFSYFKEHLLPIAVMFAMMSSAVFTKIFLKLDYNILLNKIYFYNIAAQILIFFLCLIFPYQQSIQLCSYSGVVNVIMIVTVSIVSLINNNKAARFFLLAWGIMLIGMLFYGLRGLGFINSSYFSNNGVWIGSALEVTLLSFALADRINIMKEEKEEAHNEALRIQKEATETLELKVAERTSELASANEKLREVDRVKTDFFANISHELRTPLTLILAPVEDALSGKELNSETLEMIQRNGLNLLSLINDLLDISRITAGRMKLSVSETDLTGLIKQYCGGMESAAKMKEVELVCNTSNDAVMIYADNEMIQRVISNFFSNSFKFTEPGGKIEVSLKTEGDYALIKFSDTGCGIPADKLNIIFDRFIQADTSPARRYEGTGIGLSIVKELVELHGGEVSVESREKPLYPYNHGTTFTVKLPFGKDHLTGRNDVVFTEGAEKLQMARHHIRGIEPYRETHHYTGALITEDAPSILIVEDNHDLRRLLVNMLGDKYIVYEAANGSEAVMILEGKEGIDLLLSDIMMPGMDGYELLRWVRNDERFEGLPVIFLTARADGFMKIEGLGSGATDYVTKPFNSGELLLRVKNQMELKLLRNYAIRNYNNLLQKLNSVRSRPLTGESALKIEAVCEFIKEHYMQELKREDLAEAAGMNPDTFSRFFNQHTGKTLNDFIYELRITEAKGKLVKTGDTVTRISIDTGFDNIRTFNRVFKKITGMAPGEFRDGKSESLRS
ncbi:MAG TPA: 7TM diverse intracellular signaling domain-containing protein [Spirochaetota bacterium]|nr:7TM diverse intracellular signaling domain-containing protein [Spirochaetota bacterium]HPS85865.1 7TM diverse intracellular signaling domain-containing protein [Spirochaetota bacterium]